MKKLSILLSIALILGFIFYSLDIISGQNKCTSVRKYLCKKTEKIEVVTPQIKKEEVKGGVIKEDLGTEVIKQEVINDLNPTGVLFSKGLDTSLKLITETPEFYIMDYTGNDNLRIYMAKDRSWVEKVVKNGITLSRNEINKAFGN